MEQQHQPLQQQGSGQDDRRSVQKYLRYYLYRSVQVILQSRSGKLFRCACKAQSFPEMLGLSLEDDPAIALSIKAKLGGSQELRHGDAQSVEIFLACGEPDRDGLADRRLFLEVWTFRFSEDCDPAMRRVKSFDRLVVALKALWSAARVLPAYRVARRHTSERRVLCYCIEPGASDPAVLGPGYQNRRVASVRTSAGTLCLTCSFRNPIRLGPEALDLYEGHYRLGPVGDGDGEGEGEDAVNDDAGGASPTDYKLPESPSTPPRSQSPTTAKKPSPRCLAGPFAINGDGLAGFNNGDAYEDDLPFKSVMSVADHRASTPASERCAEELYAEDPSDPDGEGDGEGESGGDQQQPAMSSAEVAAATAGTDIDEDAAAPSAEVLPFARDSSAADLQRLEQLKSGIRLEMFRAAHPLAHRIGDIPRQLEFFERDLAEFDVLLNNILERDSDSETELAHE